MEKPTMHRTMIAMMTLLIWTWASPALALPDATDLLEMMGLSAGEKQQVLNGEFVTLSPKPTSERELATAMAFIVKTPPAALVEDLKKNLVSGVDPDSIASGKITGDGTLADFAALSLGADAKKQAKLFLSAKPGEDLNLSKTEIAAFQALAKQGADEKAVEDQIRKLLLGRFQAYHSKGLDGIEPYDRGDKQTPTGGDLKRAVEAAKIVQKNAPSFYDALLNYPKSQPSGLEQDFGWTHYMAHGTPVFLLTHRLWMPDGDSWVVSQRQFYVTGSYNCVQSMAGLLPVTGGTLVVYVNRTSTDQVTGFGGSTKRTLGTKVMSSQIKDLFEKAKAAAEK